jgi:uncharacterized ion transporter superfamily protein YfcC
MLLLFNCRYCFSHTQSGCSVFAIKKVTAYNTILVPVASYEREVSKVHKVFSKANFESENVREPIYIFQNSTTHESSRKGQSGTEKEAS